MNIQQIYLWKKLLKTMLSLIYHFFSQPYAKVELYQTLALFFESMR